MAMKPMSADADNGQELVIPGLDADMDVIQKLDDEPNDVGGLTSAQLKAEFDKAGNIIKRYLNEDLLPAISGTVAEEEVRAEREAQREEAEQERVTAENGRVQAEALRAQAEALRVQAENLRAAAEQGRQSAEELRAAAEQERQSAEEARADEYTGLVAQATEQANRAKQEADRAEEIKADMEEEDKTALIRSFKLAPAEVLPDIGAAYTHIVSGVNHMSSDVSGPGPNLRTECTIAVPDNGDFYAVHYVRGEKDSGWVKYRWLTKPTFSKNGLKGFQVEDGPVAFGVSKNSKYLWGFFADSVSLSDHTYQFPSVQNWSSVGFDGSKIVCISDETDDFAYKDYSQLSSPESWNFGKMPSNSGWVDIAYGNGKFVAVSTAGKIAYSGDGIHWTEVSPSYYGEAGAAAPSFSSVAFGDGAFIAVSANENDSFISKVLDVWVTIKNTGNAALCAYCNGIFLGINTGDSFDGSVWTYTEKTVGSGTYYSLNRVENALDKTVPITALTAGFGRFLAVSGGANVLSYSFNGTDWVQKEGKFLEDNKDVTEEVRELIGPTGLTQEAADQRYLQLAGGEMLKDAKIKIGDENMFAQFDSGGLNGTVKQSDGKVYSYYVSNGAIGFGSNEIWNEIYENIMTLGGVTLVWDVEGKLMIAATRISGIPTVIDAEAGSTTYNEQASDAASVGYVRAAIEAKIGDINTVLDQINGEVV